MIADTLENIPPIFPVKYLDQKKDWDAAISLMEKVIEENPNDMSAYVNINYLLMNLLVEEDYNENKHDYYAALLKHYFTESYTKFSENAEYLFFTSRTAHISEWYFDMNREQVRVMDFKALSLDPNNILYRWVYIVLLDVKLPCNKNILLDYAKMVLAENSPIKKLLKSKGAVGEYILGIMTSVCEDYVKELT